MDASEVSRAEIMQGVRELHQTMESVVYWSQVSGWGILAASIIVIGLIIYQIILKHRENEKTNRGIHAVGEVLAEVREFLKLAKQHGELTDLQKNAMLTQMAEAYQVARLQASKVALTAEQSVTSISAKLDKLPDQTAEKTADKVVEKMTRHADDSGVTTLPKTSPGG